MSVVVSDSSVSLAGSKERLLQHLVQVVTGEVFGSNCFWNLFTVFYGYCLLMYDFHTFPCAMKLKNSLCITVWDNCGRMGKSLGGILFGVNNKPLSQPLLGVWKAVRQLQAAWCIWKMNHSLCYLTISILNLTEECWSWLLGHSSSWVNKSEECNLSLQSKTFD